MPATTSQTSVAGSARSLPLVALPLALATIAALVVCLDALVLHEVPAAIAVLAFTGAAISCASVLRALARLRGVAVAARATARALRASRALPGRPEVLVVDDAQPRAWCAGLLAPRVVVTAGAVAELSPAGLDAVIAHERHHARRRDGLRAALTDVVAAGLFLLPGAPDARDRYAAVLELDADRAAERASGGAPALATAMLALDAPGRGVDPLRVDRLLGLPVRLALPPGTAAWGLWLGLALATTAVACTVTTGCVDIFVLRETDATASRFGLLPLVALAGALLAAGVAPRGAR